ncbi:ABC transporter ATP-binding protein [Streptomyces sp. ODS28]|uniref:ABC transporter ATP-binding protein n=1 Tax=Streptomyces sp. ODS28 TaxID=3136688 RepID=UPI0031ECB090
MTEPPHGTHAPGPDARSPSARGPGPRAPDVAAGAARMPRPLGSVRVRLMGGLLLVGLGQTVCVVAFAVLAHMVADRAGARASDPEHGIYAPFAHLSAAVLIAATALTAVAAVALRAVFPPLAERLAQSYVHSVRMRLFDQVAGSVAWGTRRRTVGVTVLRFTGDSSALRMWVSRGMASLLTDGVFVVCTVTALAFFSPVGGAVTAGILLTGACCVYVLGGRLSGQLRETRRRNGRVASFVNERVTYTAVMQSLGRVGKERRELRRRSKDYSAAMVREEGFVGAVAAVAEGCRIGTYLAVIGVALADGSPAGTLAALLPLVGFLGGPLLALARCQVYWQRFQVARARISEVLGDPAQLRGPRRAPELVEGPGRLELDGLRVDGVLDGGPDGDGVHLTAEPGRRIAVTGPPGAGKSLLLALVARLQVPDAGAVLVDDQDLARCDPQSVRRAVRLVSPELPLLRGTVRKNLRHGESAGRDMEKGAGAADDVLDTVLPHGLTTQVGEGGAGLSAASRYHVALARALRSGPRVLLLDELGPDQLAGPADIGGLLGEYAGTLLYVSRDPRLTARADAVWHIENGEITERPAPHAEAQTEVGAAAATEVDFRKSAADADLHKPTTDADPHESAPEVDLRKSRTPHGS